VTGSSSVKALSLLPVLITKLRRMRDIPGLRCSMNAETCGTFFFCRKPTKGAQIKCDELDPIAVISPVSRSAAVIRYPESWSSVITAGKATPVGVSKSFAWICCRAIQRARPELMAHLVKVDTTSFPSGHAMNSAIVYLTLAALLARTEKQRQVRIYLVGAAIMLTLAIGFSRVYLGVHWPSDVLAGWCVGAAWAAICSILAVHLQKRRTIEPASEPQ
jgi:hypothetical protein